tara:strand:+ start:2188 stop:2619 length:432 start_codon:yes stop_codon:yes gene_type:complete
MCDLTSCYRLTSSDIVCEEFDGEMVVLNLATGHYFALNLSATWMLAALIRGCTPLDLAACNHEVLPIDGVGDFIQALIDCGLVTTNTSANAIPVDTTTQETAQSLTDKLSLESHDDLADLIIADPIHDTDETVGWPRVKNEAA